MPSLEDEGKSYRSPYREPPRQYKAGHHRPRVRERIGDAVAAVIEEKDAMPDLSARPGTVKLPPPLHPAPSTAPGQRSYRARRAGGIGLLHKHGWRGRSPDRDL